MNGINNSSLDFGERLQILRKRAGLSRAQLAEIIGVSYATIANYENNNSIPNISRISELSLALNTTMNMILKGYEPKRDTEIL